MEDLIVFFWLHLLLGLIGSYGLYRLSLDVVTDEIQINSSKVNRLELLCWLLGTIFGIFTLFVFFASLLFIPKPINDSESDVTS